MAAQISHSFGSLDTPGTVLRLPQHVAFDDLAAMAVLATVTMVYLFRGSIWDRPDPYVYKMYERPQQNMVSTNVQQVTRDISKMLKQTVSDLESYYCKVRHFLTHWLQGSDIVVFWGSQSGTAERLANRLCREVKQRFSKKALAADLSDYEPPSLAALNQTQSAIFIVSTFGEGEPSDNTSHFWQWLEITRGSTLKALKYAALGLGNSNYKYYNAVIDHIANRLDALGATCVLPVGKADDAKGETEEHYLDYKYRVFNILRAIFNCQEHDPVYKPSLEVTEDASVQACEVHHGDRWTQINNRMTNRLTSPDHALPVKAARELLENTQDRSCVHVEFDLSGQAGLK